MAALRIRNAIPGELFVPQEAIRTIFAAMVSQGMQPEDDGGQCNGQSIVSNGNLRNAILGCAEEMQQIETELCGC